MGDLDGFWNVERAGGALPPMLGVSKRIRSGRGETRLGPLAVPFDVRGHELHYRGALAGLVDVLEPDGDGYSGRTLLRGKELGRFRLRRGAAAEPARLEAQLVRHIDDAYAMEQSVLRLLDGMIATTHADAIRADLEQHREETRMHGERMKERLAAHDASPSAVKEAGGLLGALVKLPLDLARGEKTGRTARDAYATEHMEIASYELLERIARRAGDEATAEAARRNRAEEQAMARRLAARWDAFAELALEEAGVTA